MRGEKARERVVRGEGDELRGACKPLAGMNHRSEGSSRSHAATVQGKEEKKAAVSHCQQCRRPQHRHLAGAAMPVWQQCRSGNSAGLATGNSASLATVQVTAA